MSEGTNRLFGEDFFFEFGRARDAYLADIARRADRLRDSGVELPDPVRRAVVFGAAGPKRDPRFCETPPVLAVQRWLQSEGRPLLILGGSVGVGKTVAAATAIAAVDRGVFVRARELDRVFRARWGDDIERQRRILKAGLVVVDDLGRETEPDHMAMVLEDLLDERCSKFSRTIVTTNLDAPGLRRRYPDERLISRLRQLAHFEAFCGEDLRRAQTEHP